MKISNTHQDGNVIHYVQQNGKTVPVEKGQVKPEGKNTFPGEDGLDLSAESKDIEKIHDVLAATPDVRTEKVEALKKLVESGQYKVKSDAVADKMLKDFLWEKNR
jgi:negative regulator of flagellin synthesis FlgM